MISAWTMCGRAKSYTMIPQAAYQVGAGRSTCPDVPCREGHHDVSHGIQDNRGEAEDSELQG
jgi:hypothetical protein